MLPDRDKKGRPRRYLHGHNGKREFWDCVGFGEPQECWPWLTELDRHGYGRFRRQLAHRVMYRLTVGDPGSLCVLHACDNPPCCNPLHLFLGTQLDNLRDMQAKRRVAQGDNHWTRQPRHRDTMLYLVYAMHGLIPRPTLR